MCIVGEHWSCGELLLGPKRFTDLRTGLPHASPNILTERLRDLEESAVVRKRRLPPPAASTVYELTEWGRELEPIVTELGAWGARSPLPPDTQEIGPDSIVLALRSLFDPDAAGDLEATYGLRIGEQSFGVLGGADLADRRAEALATGLLAADRELQLVAHRGAEAERTQAQHGGRARQRLQLRDQDRAQGAGRGAGPPQALVDAPAATAAELGAEPQPEHGPAAAATPRSARRHQPIRRGRDQGSGIRQFSPYEHMFVWRSKESRAIERIEEAHS